jgi:hypothetical protein
MRSKGSMCSKGSMRSKGWDFRLPMLVFSPIFKEVKSVLGGVENLHPLQIRLGISVCRCWCFHQSSKKLKAF